MYLRSSAIRPIPPFAVLPFDVFREIERELARDGDDARAELDEAFGRFEGTQPQLADRIGEVLARPLDETALALGYFLSISIWLAFERSFGGRLREVTVDALDATLAAIALEEELLGQSSTGPLALRDLLASAQPGVLSFIKEHVDATLETPPRTRTSDGPIDAGDIDLVYHAILVLTLALSHAVSPSPGSRASDPGEMMA